VLGVFLGIKIEDIRASMPQGTSLIDKISEILPITLQSEAK
jgi:hypothetical protein